MSITELISRRVELASTGQRVEADRPRDDPPRVLLHRLLLALAAISLFGGGFNAWMSIVQLEPVGMSAVLVLGASLVTLIAAVAAKPAVLPRLDVAVLLLAIVTAAIWSASHLYFNPGYGTDEAAYVQFGATDLLHGVNPYSHSMLPALTRFNVPIQFATYTLNGGVSGQLAYPALPLYLSLPFILLTGGVQSVIIENVVFLIIGTVVTFLLLPKLLRSLSVTLMIGLPILFGYTMSGMNDLLMLPFLIAAAYRWVDVGAVGRLEWRSRWQAIALGCAMAVNPLAWIIAPFLITGIWQANSRRHGFRPGTVLAALYTLIAVSTTLVLNAPFLVWDASSWLHGVLAPLTQRVVPYGQGIVDASLFFHLGGGDIAAYTTAAGALYAAALFAQVRFFPSLGRAALILPALVLFFPTRSLAAYFMTLLPVWIVALVTCRGSRFSAGALTGPRAKRTALAGLAAALVAGTYFLGVAVATPSPLTLEIVRATTNGELQGVWQLKVRVTNHSERSLRPHFATNPFGQVTTFWHVIHGPRSLGPGKSATYLLDAPNRGSMPGLTTPFLLQAVTERPETISSAPRYTPQPFSAYLMPSYINRVVPIGHAVTFTVELRSPYGATVHRSGVRVALGQLIYAQSTLIPSEARINRGNTGQTPVFALTDEQGIAHFRVVDDYPQGGNAVYFQAWVAPRADYPFGYSAIVSVLWRR